MVAHTHGRPVCCTEPEKLRSRSAVVFLWFVCSCGKTHICVCGRSEEPVVTVLWCRCVGVGRDCWNAPVFRAAETCDQPKP